MLNEKPIERILRKHLISEGWKLVETPHERGEHGCDIIAWHPKRRKNLYIEVKGSGKHPTQAKHNAFWVLFGQILSRMDIEGNHPKKGRIYAIAIPAEWEETFKRKIQNMEYGWKLLKLPVYLIDSKGNVMKKTYTEFLK